MPPNEPPRFAGLVLAAGAGTRYGGPKGLARTASGEPWLALVARALTDAGAHPVIVVTGAAAGEVAALAPPGVRLVVAERWAEGLSASLAAGLAAASALDEAVDGLVIVPVDTPRMPRAAVTRIVGAAAHAAPHGDPRSALVQASYGGRPGHPAWIGRAHWAPLAASLSGDRGARPYLAAHGAALIDCADLWDGLDVDRR